MHMVWMDPTLQHEQHHTDHTDHTHHTDQEAICLKDLDHDLWE